MQKYFTVKTAQGLIPKIRKSLLKLKSINKAIDTISSIRLDPNELGYEESSSINIKLSKDFHKLSYEFYKEMEKFEKIGCLLKDLDQGLVDFYAKFEKRDIFLCWKLGEDKIESWHETGNGFMGRQPIISLL